MLEDVFPGKSEMARRMRELDWSTTTLGPVETWPQELRTSVSTCLECAFPIVLWWGPDLVVLYNDEYSPMLGPGKHPRALGQPGASVFPEIWDIIAPMFSQVMERAEPTRSRDLMLHIDRGYPEEAYFSFSYSPIHIGRGKVGGVFCPVLETTEKVIGERRLRTLRDLAAQCKGAESEEVVYEAAAGIIGANRHDVPFALIYRVDERQSIAELKAWAGITPGTAASPARVALDEREPGVWSLATVARSGKPAIVAGLSEEFDALPTGAWKAAPRSAMVLPVLLPGQEHPRAIVVAAVSPMRALDEVYRTFFGLVATQIASGLADAQALEEERRRAEALAELDRAKTAFFSNVSHEFRTPLTLMIGPLEDVLAGEGGTISADAARSLDVAHRNSLRLLKLVNTLLDFSRIEAGRMEASYEPTDLATFTTELASVFRSAVEKASLRLVVDCEPLPEAIYVDCDMWEKIVLNLISNAFKFTFDGEIAVRLRWRGDRAELSVADTGVGIPASDLPKMFQRFHRVKNTQARTHEGTGIGLALVQELARHHGGAVNVTSQEGRGTTFTVSVPSGTSHLAAERIAAPRRLAPTSPGAAPFVEEALRWLPGADGRGQTEAASLADIPDAVSGGAVDGRARVIVADDNADMRRYLTGLLEQAYRVEAVADGRTAFDRIRADPPDLVLSDVMMPELDGFGLLAAVRGDERTRSVPVILLSARAGEEARIEGLGADADDYMVKPFSARELLARVASQLRLAQVRREADRRKDEFLALLAHELRNPLAPIRTGLELIRLSGDTPQAVARVRTVMERQVNQMVRLIDDLLDVSRIASGKIVLQRAPSLLTDLVQSAVDAQRAAIDNANIELAVDVPPQPIAIDVDPTRMVQILSNVLHNAAKFTPPGGTIRVRAETRTADELDRPQVLITIADTGIGISTEMLPRIFELFVQAESPTERVHGGLGLGLALARRLVEMHGGEITAHSDGPGHGSAFVIRLPLSQAAVESPPSSQIDVRGIRSRVVIVDDNSDAAKTMSMLIEELGAAVRTAHDAKGGLEAVQEFGPDIVFLDIGMPGMDGYEVCRRIRRTPAGRNMVVVAVTGWGQPQDKQRALDAGFDAHLTKPVDPAALARLLAGTEVS